MAICRSCGRENPDGFEFCGYCAAPLASAPRRREQRKTVTVLFCDVTASTELGERLDPEALRALLARYFERVSHIVDRHGGTVEKFIGDAVMAVFGVPRVHEDDALRAVKAALEVRDVFPELGIEGRIGIATGEVVTGTEERLATGDAVNLAARLEQAARPGAVLIGDATLRLTRGAVEVEQLDPLTLKGKAEPVRAYRLISAEGAAGRRHEGPMVGRERERRLLAGAWERAVSERSSHLFTVLGPAGVGKSRLAAEFLASLEDARVVRGRCLPYGEGITYWPVVEVLGQLPATELDPAAGDTIAALLGEQSLVTSSEDIARAFRTLLETVAAGEPLVVVFDDLQWGEETFLELVEHVADLSRGAPILLLCMARPELLDRHSSWGGGKLNAATVLLEPLAPEETDRLIESLASLEPALRERIREASEGNPLFVEEMLAMLEESPEGDVSVPPSIQALLAARLDHLDPEERDVLQCGSVEGRVFHRGAVVALSGDEAAVGATLSALVRKELVRPDKPQLPGEDAFRFRHLLIRDAAYEALPKSTRAELHESFAGWLEGHSADVPEVDEILGYHLEQSHSYRVELGAGEETGGLAREAAQRLGAAAHRAFSRGDAAAAVNLISRAVALLPAHDPARVALLPNARVVQGLSGDLGWADHVLAEAVAAAVASGDRRLEAHALVQRGFLRLLREPDVPVRELLEVAEGAIAVLDPLGDDLGLARACRLAAQAHYLARHAGPSAEASARALGHARAAGDGLETREIVEWLCVALMLGPAPAPDVAQRCRELLAVVEQDPRLEPTVLSVLSNVEAMQGHAEPAAALLARWRAAVEGFGESIWLFPINFGFLALADDPAGAERDLRAGYEALLEIGERSGFSAVTALLARAVCAQGRYEEADRLAAESARAALPNDVHAHILWRTTRAKVLAHTGQLEAAEALAREAVAFAAESDFLDARGDALADLALVLSMGGRGPEAAAALGEAIELYERKGNALSAARARSELERAAGPTAPEPSA